MQLQGVMIELDPVRLKHGEAGDLAITVRTLDGLAVNLTGYSKLELRFTNYPRRTSSVVLQCDSGEDDAVNGICACVIEEDTFRDMLGTLEVELILELSESRLGYDNKVAAFNEKATLTGEDSGAMAGIVDDVPSDASRGYLVVEDVVGDFEEGEVIEDDGDPPGAAAVAAPPGDTLITRLKSRTAYFMIDRAINDLAP